MGCKSCKKKNSGGIIKSIIDVKKGIAKPTNYVPDNNHKLFNHEKLILVIFGWIPLGVGYYYITRFIVNLF